MLLIPLVIRTLQITLPTSIQRFFLAALLVIPFFCSQLVFAEDWRVVTEDAPPLQYLTEDGVAGYSTDMVKALLQKVELNVEIEVMPWARGFDLVLQRKNTLIYSMIRTPQREPHFQWIGRLGHFQLSFIGLKQRKGLAIDSIEGAKKWVVGAMRDDYTHKFLQQHGFTDREHLVVRSQLSELVDLLYKERIDTFIVDVELLRPMIKELGFEETLVTSLMDITELTGDVYLAANVKSDADMVKTMKKAFNELFGDRPAKQRFLMPGEF